MWPNSKKLPTLNVLPTQKTAYPECDLSELTTYPEYDLKLFQTSFPRNRTNGTKNFLQIFFFFQVDHIQGNSYPECVLNSKRSPTLNVLFNSKITYPEYVFQLKNSKNILNVDLLRFRVCYLFFFFFFNSFLEVLLNFSLVTFAYHGSLIIFLKVIFCMNKFLLKISK